MRADGRWPDQLRAVRFQNHIAPHATGSVLVSFGNTRVICAATIEDDVPRWMKQQRVEGGWLTAEYAMLPYSTLDRKHRDITRGKLDGRSSEIQRLIGRALRTAVDLKKVGSRTIWVDCDVLQADGGTRTAAITGAWVAANLALARLLLTGDISEWPVRDQVAAVSVGIVGGVPLLDLEYVEDQGAEVDMNVVATAGGSVVEIQGTGEKRSFRREEMDALVDLAFKGIGELAEAQNAVLAPTLEEVREVLGRGRRRQAPAKSEKDLWGRP